MAINLFVGLLSRLLSCNNKKQSSGKNLDIDVAPEGSLDWAGLVQIKQTIRL